MKMDNKATSDSPTTIYDLPHNALVRIGRFLNWFDIVEFRLCSRKCKEMAEVMLEKGLKEISLYNDLDRDLDDDPNPYTPIRYCTKLRKCEFTSMNLFKDKKMHQFLSNNPHLKEVSISHMRNTTTAGILPLANCMNLSKLTLVCVPIDDKFLRRLTRHKIHLVEVELTHLKITVRGARDFFRAQPLLEKITLAMRHDDIRPCLLTISKHCPKLKSLDIHNANLNDDNECALRFAKKCPTLKEICLRYNDMYEFTWNHPVVEALENLKNGEIDVLLHEADDSDISDFESSSSGSDSEFLRSD